MLTTRLGWLRLYIYSYILWDHWLRLITILWHCLRWISHSSLAHHLRLTHHLRLPHHLRLTHHIRLLHHLRLTHHLRLSVSWRLVWHLVITLRHSWLTVNRLWRHSWNLSCCTCSSCDLLYHLRHLLIKHFLKILNKFS